MKQPTWLTPIGWVMLAMYLVAATVLVLGGIFMFFAGFFRG